MNVPRCREHNAPLADHPACDFMRRFRLLFGEMPEGACDGLTVGVGVTLPSNPDPICVTTPVEDAPTAQQSSGVLAVGWNVEAKP